MRSLFEDYQRILLPYAYNVLGTVADAEDVIQDVIIQFSKISIERLSNPKNYLIKSVINRAIEVKRKRKRTVRADIWLPEPVITGPDHRYQEVFNYGLLARMEYLSPKERAVFILKTGYNHSHEEIGEILSYTPENSRKILSRARGKLKRINHTDKVRYRHPVSDSIKKLIDAIQNENSGKVRELLTEDIQFYADGGANLELVANACTGHDLVSQLLIHINKTYHQTSVVKIVTINHQPAVLYILADQILSCQVFEIQENKIIQVFAIVDPQKLQRLNRTKL